MRSRKRQITNTKPRKVKIPGEKENFKHLGNIGSRHHKTKGDERKTLKKEYL